MKKYTTSLLGVRLLAIAFLLFAIASPLRAADPVTFNIPTMLSGETAMGQALKHWAAGVNSKTDGRVVLRIITDGTGGDEQDILAALDAGKMEGAILSAWALADMEQDIVAACLPYTFEGPANYMMFLQFFQDQLQERFAAKGYLLADLALGGEEYLLSKEKINSPDALSKEKFAVANSAEATYWSHFGMKTTEIRPSGFTPGFQSGKFSAFSMSPLLIKRMGLGELPRSKQGFQLMPYGVLLRQSAWDKITPADRRIISQALESLMYGACQKGFAEKTQFQLPGYKSKGPVDIAKKEWQDFFEAGKQKVIAEMLSEDMRKKLLETGW